MHRYQFILKFNLNNVYFNLTYKSSRLFSLQKNQEGLGAGFLLSLWLNFFIIPDYMISYSESKRHIEK